MALGETIDIDNPASNGGYVVSEDWDNRVWTVERETYLGERAENVVYREESGRQTYRFKGKTLGACQAARNDIIDLVPIETPGYSRVLTSRTWVANDHTNPKAYDFELTIAVRFTYRDKVQMPTT